jgi:hypothetical protein
MTEQPDDEPDKLSDEELMNRITAALDEALPPLPPELAALARAQQPRPDPPPDIGDAAVQHPARIARQPTPGASPTARPPLANLTDHTGEVTTELWEEDGQLAVLITSADPGVEYVVLSWRPIEGEAHDPPQRLVTPLAVGPAVASVRYTLGPLGSATEIEIEPAKPIAITQIDAADLEPALALPQTGASGRAWQRARILHLILGDELAALIETRHPWTGPAEDPEAP